MASADIDNPPRLTAGVLPELKLQTRHFFPLATYFVLVGDALQATSSDDRRQQVDPASWMVTVVCSTPTAVSGEGTDVSEVTSRAANAENVEAASRANSIVEAAPDAQRCSRPARWARVVPEGSRRCRVWSALRLATWRGVAASATTRFRLRLNRVRRRCLLMSRGQR